ncbi:MAG: hypothetical protein NXH72_09675 [Hyphomonadaceae bacterium]|nr:hypothetical protein [Hyphomonadaceae bacterium]
MKPRAAALALAAPLLFTAPALADHGKAGKTVTGSVSVQTGNGTLHFGLGHNGYSSIGYSTNRYYGDRGYRGHDGYYHNNRKAKRRAIRACRQAIRNEAYHLGFRDVDFDDGRYAEQIGPRGYRVTFNEVEFEGFRRDFERPVTCIVRGGDRVRDIRGIPIPGKRGHNRRHGGYRY